MRVQLYCKGLKRVCRSILPMTRRQKDRLWRSGRLGGSSISLLRLGEISPKNVYASVRRVRILLSFVCSSFLGNIGNFWAIKSPPGVLGGPCDCLAKSRSPSPFVTLSPEWLEVQLQLKLRRVWTTGSFALDGLVNTKFNTKWLGSNFSAALGL